MSDDNSRALRKLEERVAHNDEFTPEERRALRQVLAVYEGIEAWGRVGRAAVVGLAALAAAVTAWEVLTAKVRVWLGG